MKRNFKLFTLVFALMFAIVVKVNAEEVKTETELTTCLNTKDAVCKLTGNVELSDTFDVSSTVTLDLNGYTITKSDKSTTDSIFIVLRGAKLTINDSSAQKTGKIDAGNDKNVYAAIKITKKGETSEDTASLVVNGGTLIGYFYAISGNGTRHNTNITINGGKLTAIDTKEGLGIYHPQKGTLTINGGVIEGSTGIEIRAGKLVVNGGTIIGTAVPTTILPNGNGNTTTGAGVAVAQHTTKLDLDVVVNGGTIKGYTALYESNPQKNDAEAIAKVKLSVKGGTFAAINGGKNSIYAEDFKLEDIMNLAKDEKYYEVINSDGEKKYVVVSEDEIKLDVVAGAVKEDEVSATEVTLIKNKIDKKYNLATYLDIILGKFANENDMIGLVSEADEAVSVTISIPTTLEKVKEGYTRKYVIVRVHNGVTDIIDDVKINDDGTLTFKTDKFSTYALAYQDIEKVNASNPNTGDNVLTFIIIGLVSLIVAAFAMNKLRKNA